MLCELQIKNLAVIDSMTIPIETKYLSLIGETGSGKSIIVSAISFLNGERCDYSLIREKTKKAVVLGVFHLDPAFLLKHEEVKDYIDEEGNLIIKRVMNPDKTTRNYINGEPFPLSTLKEVMSHVLSLHSQNSNSDLFLSQKQLSYIDFYCGKEIVSLKKEYLTAFETYKKKREELENLISSHKDLDRDYLSFQINEIEKYHLKENEIEDLNDEYSSLREKEIIQEKYEDFLSSFENETISLQDLLSKAISKIHSLENTPLKEKAQALKDSFMAVLDDMNSLEESYESLSIDPKRIDEINSRLFQLKDLQRKYGKTTSQILTKYQDFKEKLDFVDNFAFEVEKRKDEIQKQKEEVERLAEALSEKRKESALFLSKDINEEMSSLGLRKNGFEIQIQRKEFDDNGMDKVDFLVCFNKGLEKQPLSKAASGGEASRLMLAIKIVLNKLDPYDTMVLDEIDTGISGRSADLVSRKFQSLSSDSSLIVVSHLPQVVASSSGSIQIEKKVDKDSTFAECKSLSKEEFLAYIARMLSGNEVTEVAKKQAEELYKEYHEKNSSHRS